MPLAIGLLTVMAVACALSSLVTQGQPYSWYVSKYGERTAAVIIALHGTMPITAAGFWPSRFFCA